MLDRKKTLKTTKGIVARRKPKKTGVGSSSASNKKECDLRKFNLSLPNDLFLQVAAAAAAKNAEPFPLIIAARLTGGRESGILASISYAR